MGKIWMSGGGGGGLDPDDLTATPAQVLAGYKAGVKGLDEPAAGTMVNQGAKTATLNAGGSYTIPAGYHNGAGKVTANALSGQTAGTAAAADIRKNKTAWTNGTKITGNMPEQGGSTTTPGTANKTIVAANRYVTGNIIVAGASTLTAANIKKNVTIFGIKGSFEGWVPTATDLYYNGVNTAGFTIERNFVFENTRIFCNSTGTGNNYRVLICPKSYDVKSFSKLNIQGNFETTLSAGGSSNIAWDKDIWARYTSPKGTTTLITFDITQVITISANWEFRMSDYSYGSYITRIWLS